MTAISIRFDDNLYRQIKKDAEFNGKSITAYARNAIIEHLEDQQDYRDAVKAEQESDGITYSAEEVKKKLGI